MYRINADTQSTHIHIQSFWRVRICIDFPISRITTHITSSLFNSASTSSRVPQFRTNIKVTPKTRWNFGSLSVAPLLWIVIGLRNRIFQKTLFLSKKYLNPSHRALENFANKNYFETCFAFGTRFATIWLPWQHVHLFSSILSLHSNCCYDTPLKRLTSSKTPNYGNQSRLSILRDG